MWLHVVVTSYTYWVVSVVMRYMHVYEAILLQVYYLHYRLIINVKSLLLHPLSTSYKEEAWECSG